MAGYRLSFEPADTTPCLDPLQLLVLFRADVLATSTVETRSQKYLNCFESSSINIFQSLLKPLLLCPEVSLQSAPSLLVSRNYAGQLSIVEEAVPQAGAKRVCDQLLKCTVLTETAEESLEVRQCRADSVVDVQQVLLDN